MQVFREQRAVWVKNYDSFGYSPTGQSPAQTPNTPDVSATGDFLLLFASSNVLLQRKGFELFLMLSEAGDTSQKKKSIS